MTPEQQLLKLEWERANEERNKLWELIKKADKSAKAAQQAYYESISEFKIGDFVYDKFGKLFQITQILLPNNWSYRGAIVKKDGTLSKKSNYYIWEPLTKVEKP